MMKEVVCREVIHVNPCEEGRHGPVAREQCIQDCNGSRFRRVFDGEVAKQGRKRGHAKRSFHAASLSVAVGEAVALTMKGDNHEGRRVCRLAGYSHVFDENRPNGERVNRLPQIDSLAFRAGIHDTRSVVKRRPFGTTTLPLMPSMKPFLLLAMIVFLWSVRIVGAADDDWPMWRCDAQRSASTTNSLPSHWSLLWSKDLTPRTQAWDDPLNLDLMTYDRIFEPIVVDGRLIVGFNDQNKTVAFDTDSGRKLWTVYTEAPVRLPPAAADGRVYFCCDDGYLYCVEVATGKLLWKFFGAPNRQHALGNRRLTSAWPSRGGPVVRDKTVYFCAGIWPFMGTFIYALDTETGTVQWVNDHTGAQYIKQPHSAPAFAGIAPQGALVATEDMLIIPGGRSVPAAFDRATGKMKYFHFNAGGKGTGGSFVTADENHYYVHTRRKGTRAFRLDDGVKTSFMPTESVLHQGMVYSAETYHDEPVIRAYDSDHKKTWGIAADGSGDLILAGDTLVAAGKDAITIIALPSENQDVRVLKAIPISAETDSQRIERLIVADSKLFVVTLEGRLMAFGEPSADQENPNDRKTRFTVPDPSTATAVSLLDQADAEGYAIWYGSANSDVARAIALNSPFEQFAIVDKDPQAVDRLRRLLDASSLYGRVTVHESRASEFKAPQHIANVLFIDHSLTVDLDEATLKELYRSVRPYGGVMHVLVDGNGDEVAAKIRSWNLEQAEVETGQHSVIVRRVGALPGSADWTHQYGDIANSVKSNDHRVKLPLGVLWFGGSSNMDVLPRHGHGPPEQVIGGRLFIQGMDCLSARDVYTGRVLWKRTFDNLGTFDLFYDKTYEDTPLSPQYNQVHIPGANGRGTNYVATEDRLYLVEGGVCRVLDPATGKTLKDFHLPGDTDHEDWGFIGVYKNVLLGGVGFANYQKRRGLTFDSDQDLKRNRSGFGSKSFDRSASIGLVGLDRYSGKVLWEREANHSFWHNGIVAGGDMVYCLDRNPKQVEDAMRRRGISNPDSYRIVAIDYRTGKTQWEINEDVFGTWLGYSEKHHVLLQAGAAASDRLSTETSHGMAVYGAADGSSQWQNRSLKYAGPCILHNDWIITNANSYRESAGAFHLLDGRQKMLANPLTGQLQPWTMTRSYGCNNIIASENLLTFRSGAAGFYDLLTDSGTGNLGGFKSGCTSNLVVAGGVLNAPDYTRTCSCGYQNQTSLALVHMPSMDMWSVNLAVAMEGERSEIREIGINFGAPGDRRDANGRLWIEYPAVADPAPELSIKFNQEARLYQHHSSSMIGKPLPWVMASGMDGVTQMSLRLDLGASSESTGIAINHDNDDAEEDERGRMDLGSSDLEMTEEEQMQIVGLRFNRVPLTSTAKIRYAYIQFTCDETSKDDTALILAAEDVGNASRFRDTKHDLSSRSRTSVEVDWSPSAWRKTGKSGKAQRTPNLAPLLESIIGRPDWERGNSVALLISGSGKRVASAWRKGSKKSARLVIDADDPDAPAKVSSEQTYRVRLLFGLPRDGDPDRIFDVFAQGEQVLQDVTLSRQSGKQAIVKVLENVAIADVLHLRFVPKQGDALLSGIEVVRID